VASKNRALRAAVVAGAITRFIGSRLASENGVIAAQHRHRWERQNHRGETVTLYEGPALGAGLAVGAALGGACARTKSAAALAVAGAATFGIIDDLTENTEEKGLRGHVGAALRGKLTTGGLKILGIGATSVAAAALGRRSNSTSRDVIVNGMLIATSANLANLFDLRPGRVLKIAGGISLPLALTTRESGLAGAVVGASLAAAAEDLDEKTMAGDGGANALGALVGATVAFSAPRWAREAALLGTIGLTVASERWSFSEFIDKTPWAKKIDSWGRRR